MGDSNVGETGIESTRIGGKRLEELSVVDQMRARKQIVLSAAERRVKDIKDRYPRYKVPNLESGITEAEANIVRFEEAILKERKTIKEFSAYLALCRQRDVELRAAGVEV